MADSEIRSHPLLRRRRTELNHGFSSSQMESMAAFCEALIPSLPLFKETPLDQSLLSFYQASASQAPVPDEVAELLVERAHPKAVFLVKVVLRLLSLELGHCCFVGLFALIGDGLSFLNFLRFLWIRENRFSRIGLWLTRSILYF